MSYPASQLYTVPVPNGSLTATNYNAEFQNVYLNVGKPENIDDYCENVVEMQIQTDPGEVGSESQPTTLAGELERIRFAIKEVKQKIDPTVLYWYQTPGNLNLGGVANTDTFTIYAQNDAFTQTVLTLKSDTVAGTAYKFLECFSDFNGTPSTRVTIDGEGNLTTLGTITTTGQLTVLDIPGVRADKLILSEAGTGVNHITLQGPDSASTTTHVITLPGALPSAQSFMLIDATGQVSYSLTPIIADQIGMQMTSVGADAVAATMTVTGANAVLGDVSNSVILGSGVANRFLELTDDTHNIPALSANRIRNRTTRDVGQTVGLGGFAISPSCGTGFQVNGGGQANVTNLSITITTSGRPVFVGLIPADSNRCFLRAYVMFVSTMKAYIMLQRGGTTIFISDMDELGYLGGSPGAELILPPSAVWFIDQPGVGTFTYNIRAGMDGAASAAFYWNHIKLIAYEL